jgi:probable 2-oxoglutarate dehydrogenase E1 component DHKTD1
MLQEQWKSMVWPASKEADSNPGTGVEREILVKVGQASVKSPDEFVSCCYCFKGELS